MPVVRLGHEDGQVTVAHVPDSDGWSEDEKFNSITHDDGLNAGVWVSHKHHSGTYLPAWVESNDPELESRIAAYYRCPIGEPAIESAPPNETAAPSDAVNEVEAP